MTITKKVFRDMATRNIIAQNIRGSLAAYKTEQGVTECPCCKRAHPNPYTQEWVAEQIGVSKATIVHYFQGNREPSVSRLLDIAEALNVRLADLLKGVDHD